jgi:predicted CopG family antitoxin
MPKKPGRPKIPEKTKRLNITVSPEVYSYLQTVPNISSFLSNLVSEFLKKKA